MSAQTEMIFCRTFILVFVVCFAGLTEMTEEECECNYCIMDECTTLVAENPFKAEEDAHKIYDAFTPGHKLEETLTSILYFRTENQRLEIASAYKHLAGRPLDDIKWSGYIHFVDLFVAMIKPLDIYLAEEIDKSLKEKSGGVNGGSRIIEILVNTSPCVMRNTEDSFWFHHIYTLNYAIESKFHGSTKQLLRLLATGYRKECDTPNIESAKKDAMALMKAGVERWGTDGKTFREVFALRSYPQLREIIRQYDIMRKNQDGNFKSIRDDLKGEFTDSTLQTYLMLVEVAQDQPGVLALWLDKALEYKMNDLLVFVVRISFDTNLADVKAAYSSKFDMKLADRIKSVPIKQSIKSQLNVLFALQDLDLYPSM